MNPEKYLVLIKNKDKTLEVLYYNPLGGKVEIIFKGNDKKYTYYSRDVIYKKNPRIIDVSAQSVYLNDSLLLNCSKLLIFGDKAKIIFNEGHSQIYEYKSIKYGIERPDNVDVLKILKNWVEISSYTKTNDENDGTFLRKQFARLNNIKEKSVLNSYLNGSNLSILPSVDKNVIFPFKFNISQKQALDNALRSNISVIEGPPGTGKTQTILNIVANLAIMRNKTVAVVSGNNSAVQNVMEKLEEEKYHFIAASLGNKKNKDNFFANLPSFDVANWKSDEGEKKLIDRIIGLNQSIHKFMELSNKKAKLQQELSGYRLEQKHFEKYYNNQNIEEIKRLSFYRQTPEKIISFLADNHLAKEQGKSDSLFNKAKLFLKYGFTDFKSIKEKEMEVILNLQRKYYIYKLEFLEKKNNEIQSELEREEFKDVLNKHLAYSICLFQHKLYEKYHAKKKLNLNSRNYKENFKKFIEHFPVILSTTHSLRNSVPDDFMFDYVIIDESSQVDLLTGVLALSCCKNVIIVGDTKQLPQIVDKTILDGLKNKDIPDTYDYFKHNILSSILSLYNEALPKVTLKEHYRCHPKIIQFCNQKYYGGELIPYTSESDSDIPLVLYRTSKGKHMREITRGDRKGRFNQRELEVIKYEILKNPELQLGNDSDIGFTTPYRKQVEKAVSLLGMEIESDTIHKYQGRQKPIMIMSTVLDQSYSGKLGIPFVDDPCIINVAVSRAQNKFILVTDHSMFSKQGKEVSDLIRYIEYSVLDKNVIDSEIVSVFDLLYKEYSDKLISLQSSLLRISKYKSENIMWTIINELMVEEKFTAFEAVTQVKLKNLLKNTNKLTDEEQRYVKNNSSVDFVIYHKLNKQPILAIEVDGFAFHENNPVQMKRDNLKNRILEKYNLELIRFPTTGSNEKEKLQNKLNELINGR